MTTITEPERLRLLCERAGDLYRAEGNPAGYPALLALTLRNGFTVIPRGISIADGYGDEYIKIGPRAVKDVVALKDIVDVRLLRGPGSPKPDVADALVIE